MRLPAILTPHTVTVRDLIGVGGMGPVHGAARTLVSVRVEEGTQLVASGTGEQVTSSAQVFIRPDHAPVTVGSLVTLPSGREAEVLTVEHHHTDPAPEHYVLHLT